jgi:hypothetical protein
VSPILIAILAVEPPVIDGALDDAVWKQAPASESFTQKFPASGEPPLATTSVRVVHDREAIYFGIHCAQPNTPITRRLSRRDRTVEADRVAIDIDTRGDGKSAFHFEVNASGLLVDAIRFDELVTEDSDLLLDWDENWDASTQTSSGGWTAEIRIPFRALRFDQSASRGWGLEVRRYVSAHREIDEWAYVPRDVAGEMQHYGRLELEGEVEPGSGIELRPFALAKSELAAPTFSAGGDARIHLSSELTVDLTVNPDFGQVEADEVVLNLSNLELLFPEKRPFFLEGQSAFTTPLPLLYTRRVGERSVPIVGAAKLVGSPLSDLTLGLMAAMTSPQDPDPMSLYSVLRLKLEASEQTSIGAIATGVQRFDRGQQLHDAYTGGFDFKWRSGDYAASGQVVGSMIVGGTPRQLLDGTTLSAGDLGLGGVARMAKEGGDWLFELEYHGLSRALDLNDAGFLERQNLQRFWFAGAYRTIEPLGPFLENKTQIELFHRRSFDGLNLAEGYQINNSGKISTFLDYFVELHYRARHFDDRELGNGLALERAGLFGLELAVATDPRRAIAGEIATTAQLLRGGVNLLLEATLRLNVLPELDLDLIPAAIFTNGEPRYVEEAEGSWIFGRQRAAGFGLTLRATYTFTPKLSLQAYLQLFLDSVRYREFSSYDGSERTIRLSALRPAEAPLTDPDFEEASLNANVVLRYEYLPGSTLFLVYTRAQSGALAEELADREPSLSFRSLARSPSSDIILVKVSYWWGS